MNYDKRKKIPSQQKFDCKSCSNSKDNDSPRLIITMRTKTLGLNQNNSRRVAV